MPKKKCDTMKFWKHISTTLIQLEKLQWDILLLTLCHMEIYGTNLEAKVDLSNEQINSNNNNNICNTSITINTFTLLLTIIIK